MINPYGIVVDIIHVTDMYEAYGTYDDDDESDIDDDTDNNTGDDTDDDIYTHIIVSKNGLGPLLLLYLSSGHIR